MYEILQNEHNDKEFQKGIPYFYGDGTNVHDTCMNGNWPTANQR